MNWKEQLDKAVKSLRDVAESDTVKGITTKAKETATHLAQRARTGALSAAEAYVEANADPAVFRVHFLNADLSILSPSDGVTITHPSAGTLAVMDDAGNGLIINATPDPAYVAETVGTVTRLNANTYDIGAEDGINVVVLKA
ncbi:MAG: hypothetical protein WAN46_07050 [Gammaproteobacteria bacterium]|jgi:hypothetical protein